MKLKLHHINFVSKDLQPEPSLAASRVTGSGYPGKVTFVSDGSMQLHLAERDLGVPFRTGQAVNPVDRGHIAFRTDDIAAFKQRLRDRGVPFSDYGAWAMQGWQQIFFHDSEGNVVEVHQVADDAQK